jgi:hypothetical protein
MTHSAFVPLTLSLRQSRTWLFSTLFVIGNLVLPQLCHLLPQGGMIFLPIYFFTLIAAYKFGLKAGLLTALISPLANHLLFGMPMASMLPIILLKSVLLAVISARVAQKSRMISLMLLVLVVLAYQLLGGLGEWAITGSLTAAIQDFKLGYPGMLLQVVGGFLLLKTMADYER